MKINQIIEFLYEIDQPVGSENCVLSDEQIFQLADEIFNNKEKLIELINNGT